MEVLKLCVVQGVQALNLGVPILAEELARTGAGSGKESPDGPTQVSARTVGRSG